MQILRQGQPASTLLLLQRTLPETNVPLWLGSAACSAYLAHSSVWLFGHLLQHSPVPEALCLFRLEPGITLLLPVGTRLSCYLWSDERKTWTLWRTFPRKEDNTSVPFIRGEKSAWQFGSKTYNPEGVRKMTLKESIFPPQLRLWSDSLEASQLFFLLLAHRVPGHCKRFIYNHPKSQNSLTFI